MVLSSEGSRVIMGVVQWGVVLWVLNLSVFYLFLGSWVNMSRVISAVSSECRVVWGMIAVHAMIVPSFDPAMTMFPGEKSTDDVGLLGPVRLWVMARVP